MSESKVVRSGRGTGEGDEPIKEPSGVELWYEEPLNDDDGLNHELLNIADELKKRFGDLAETMDAGLFYSLDPDQLCGAESSSTRYGAESSSNGVDSVNPTDGERAAALTEFHRHFRPSCPSWNGDFPFTSFTLVDDGALTTVDLGLRANLSAACYLVGMFAVFGVGAMNVKKFKTDGQWSTTVPIWGLTYNLGHHLEYSVSSVRLEKVRLFFSDRIWDPGGANRGKLTVKLVQRGVGQLRHIGQVCRPVHHAYRSLQRMLRVEQRGQQLVDPPGTASEKEMYWTNLGETIEFLRIVLSDSDLWRTTVIAPFTSVVSVAERLSIPGEKENLVAIGSDSTPWLLSVFTYETKECGWIVWTKEVVEAIAEALKETGVPDHLLEEMIISIKELAAAVVMHTAWGKRTRGKFYVNLNDNFNACRWVFKRVAQNPFAAHLLFVLGMLEMVYGNDSHLIYVNTHRNEIADYATRWVETVEEAQALVAHFDKWLSEAMPGWVRIDIASDALPYFITPWRKRSLALVDENNPVPKALAAADGRALDVNDADKIEALLQQQLGGVSEVDAHRAGVIVFQGIGAGLVAKQIKYHEPTLDVLAGGGMSTATGRYLAASRNPLSSINANEEVDGRIVIRIATGTSPSYCEASASRMMVPCLLWVHVSPAEQEHVAEADAAELGYKTTVLDVAASSFGEASTRRWWLIVHERLELDDLGPPPDLLDRVRERPAILDHLAPLHLLDADDACWLHSRIDDPKLVFSEQANSELKASSRGHRRRGVPKLLGHIVEGLERHAVYHLNGTASALASSSSPHFGTDYYFDTRADVVKEYKVVTVKVQGEVGVLRRLTKYDAWMIAGNPLVELLEWERLHLEDDTSIVPEPTDEAVSAHLAVEPSVGLAAAVARVYGKRVVRHLRARPRPPLATSQAQELAEADGFVPPDFDAAELTSGKLWQAVQPPSFEFNPNAAEFNPAPTEVAAEQEAASERVGEPERAGRPRGARARRLAGRGGGLGAALTLMLLLTMGMAAQAAPGGCAASTSRWGSLTPVILLMLLFATTTLASSPGGGRARIPVHGFNPISDLPKLFEDLPRGDRRGQGVSGRRFLRTPPERAPPKPEPRRKYRTSRSAPFTSDTHDAIEKEKKRLAASALSKSTIKSYDTAWRQWSDFLYNEYGQLHPFLTGENKREDVEKGIAFVSYLSSFGRAQSTIKKKLSGIRFHHRRHGLADPFADSPALTYHLKGLKKLAGAARGKMPATKDLLEHVNARLSTGSVMLACLNAAIQLAFFVLLRTSEYCVIPLSRNGAFDPDSTLLDGDVMLICRGKMLPWDEVEDDDYPHVSEVVISIKKSKTDQNRVGVTRSAERTGERLCVVAAILRFIKLRLEYGVTSSVDSPFFRWGNDFTQHLRRDSVSKALKHSAKLLGQHVSEYASHSLRIGGATALIHSGASAESVRRFGRWKSDTWQQCSWSTRGLLSGLSKLMAKSEYTLEMSTQQFMAARRTAGRERGELPEVVEARRSTTGAPIRTSTPSPSSTTSP